MNLGAIILGISAVIALAAFPPVGMVLAILAFASQRRQNGRRSRAYQEARREALEQQERTLILAFKSLP